MNNGMKLPAYDSMNHPKLPVEPVTPPTLADPLVETETETADVTPADPASDALPETANIASDSADAKTTPDTTETTTESK